MKTTFPDFTLTVVADRVPKDPLCIYQPRTIHLNKVSKLKNSWFRVIKVLQSLYSLWIEYIICPCDFEFYNNKTNNNYFFGVIKYKNISLSWWRNCLLWGCNYTGCNSRQVSRSCELTAVEYSRILMWATTIMVMPFAIYNLLYFFVKIGFLKTLVWPVYSLKRLKKTNFNKIKLSNKL